MGPPLNLLLVEDNPGDARLFAEELRDAPAPRFRVQEVDRLDAAIAYLRRASVDLIVLDLSLPDSHGLETFDAVAAAAADTPVVVLSGLHDDHVAMHAVRRGAQDYLVKGRSAAGELTPALVAAVERHRTERDLAHRADFDGLTGLPRGPLLQRRLGAALGRAERDGRSLPLLHVELEGLGDLAVAHGPAAADGLRRAAAERVMAGLGASDLLGHPDEDGLAVVAESVAVPTDAAALARRLLEAVGRPFTIEGRPVLTAGRVGIGVCPADGSAPLEALANARAAARRAAGGTYEFCDREMTELTRRRHAIEADLYDATRAGEMLLHFQPLVRPGSGEVTAVEALMRWNHPSLGLLAPREFIPVAERTGVIVELGEWALGAACWQLRAWDRHGLPPIGMSVNVSARQFASPALVPAVEDALVATGLEPRRLELEVTESMLADPDGTADTLARLRDIGVRVAIDDFGTGWSSLTYLNRFPIDTIKIDRSFVSRWATMSTPPTSPPRSSDWPTSSSWARWPKASRPSARPASCSSRGATGCRASACAARSRARRRDAGWASGPAPWPRPPRRRLTQRDELGARAISRAGPFAARAAGVETEPGHIERFAHPPRLRSYRRSK